MQDWVPYAQIVSGVAAALGLGFNAWGLWFNGQQVRRARVGADLQAMQSFFNAVSDRERALADAKGDAAKQHAFYELINFLEIYSLAHNRELLGDATEELVRHKLIDSYIELDGASAWHPMIAGAIDRSTTFVEFRNFVKANRIELAERKAERQRLFAEGRANG